MITNYLENNYLVLVGKITSDKKFSHEIYGESFYVFNLEVPRLSQTSDIIPITISTNLLKPKKKIFLITLIFLTLINLH